jgi:phosphatidate cytidylyltransferase
MMKDLKNRLLISSIFVGSVILLFLFARNPIVHGLIALVLAALSAVAIWEYVQFAKKKGSSSRSRVLMGLGALITLSFCPMTLGLGGRLLPQGLFLAAFLVAFALHFREKKGAVIDLAVSVFGLLYIAVPLGMVLAILYWPQGGDGRMWVTYLLSVTKMADVGAYFGGHLLGRRKLAPTISPKKTIEGAIAGLVTAVATSYLFYMLGMRIDLLPFQIGFWESLLLGFVLGGIGQFGDLSESLLKRDAEKKDSNGLPGIGGILDVVDSLLFNIPLIYFYLILSRSGGIGS